MNDNIKEIQELYKDMEQKKKSREQRVKDKVILIIKSYKVSSLSSTMKLSFIDNEVNNLIKYIKFIRSST